MSSITPLHVYRAELEKLLNEEIERLMESISFGHLENFAEYKFSAGKVAGLRLAQDYLLEAEQIYKERVL
jgi:hypothetical protein